MAPTTMLIAAVIVAGTSCSGGGDDATAAPTQADRLADASEGLCDALLLAERGDVEGASRVFQDEVHAYLHELAGRLSTFDRVAAAELLEAKQHVEEALANGTEAETVRDLMAALQRELQDAAAAAGLPQHACLVEMSQ